MNTILVTSVPTGDFEEINIGMSDWKARFMRLVQERKPVKYDVYTMPNLPKEIQNALSKQGYCDQILESDKDQHYLTPIQTTSGV